jgi:hypothetical protein
MKNETLAEVLGHFAGRNGGELRAATEELRRRGLTDKPDKYLRGDDLSAIADSAISDLPVGDSLLVFKASWAGAGGDGYCVKRWFIVRVKDGLHLIETTGLNGPSGDGPNSKDTENLLMKTIPEFGELRAACAAVSRGDSWSWDQLLAIITA